MPTIAYPLDMPANPSGRKIDLKIQRTISFFESPFTRERVFYEYPDGSFWEGIITLPPMKRAEASAWQVFLMQLHGQIGTFRLAPMGETVQQGNPLSGANPQLVSISTDGLSIVTNGWNINTAGHLLPGDWFQFTNNEMKKITNTVSSDGSGLATINFEPKLRDMTVGIGTDIVYTTPKGLFRSLTNDVASWSLEAISIYGFSLAIRESV